MREVVNSGDNPIALQRCQKSLNRFLPITLDTHTHTYTYTNKHTGKDVYLGIYANALAHKLILELRVRTTVAGSVGKSGMCNRRAAKPTASPNIKYR